MTMDIAQIVLLSLQVGLVGAGCAALVAIPVSFILARVNFRGKWVLSGLTLLPLVMPPVVTGYILLVVFGPKGAIGGWLAEYGIVFGFRWTGAALAAGLVAFPLIVRPLRLSFEAVDPKLHEALVVAGHGRWGRFVKLDMPLIWPGLLGGFVLGFAKALGEFGATITFVANIPGETQTLSLAVFSALQSNGGEMLVWRLCLISIGISLVAVFASELMLERFDRRQKANANV